MEPAMTGPPAAAGFSEEEWMRLLFLLSDTQAWVDDLSRRLFHQVPMADRKRLFRRGYYLTASALAHILERHYYKIPATRMRASSPYPWRPSCTSCGRPVSSRQSRCPAQ